MLIAALVALSLAVAPPDSFPDAALAGVSADRLRMDVETLASFGTRHTLSDTASPTRGIGAARAWLRSELDKVAAEAGGRMTVAFEEFDAPPSQRLPEGARVVNVVAVLEGASPEARHRRYYVVGHYDSRNADAMDGAGEAPGANDDASGTALVLEAARVLAPLRLDATVVFLCTAAEEQGLIGAAYHASQAASRRETIAAVLSNDIVGDAQDPHDDAVRLFSEGIPRNPSAEALAKIRAASAESDSSSRQLARQVAEIAALHALPVRPILIFRPDRFLRGGDHSAFNEAGFPAVRFTTPTETYDRQHVGVTDRDGAPYGDLASFVNFPYLANVARLNVAALIHLANAPATPAEVRVVTARLETDTTLRWAASPDPDTAGYEVVWRRTTAAQWEHRQDVGPATEAKLPISKDDHFFGVRAYDRDGYRSPVAFAGAAKE